MYKLNTMGAEKLSNIQLELIKLYQFSIDDKQLLEIKSLLGNYFAKNATEEMDALWQKNNWTNETMDNWLNDNSKK